MSRRRSSDGGSGAAALVFLGIAAGVTVLSTSRKAHAQTAPPDGGRGKRFATPPSGPAPAPTIPASRYPSGVPQMDATYTLQTWQPIVATRIASTYPTIPQAFAMKWLDIESGGNPCAVGDPGQLGQGSDQPAEIGLGQLYNPDDFVHLKAPPAASFRAYAPAAAPLAAAYRQAQASGDKATMASIARQMQTRTRALTPSEMDDQVHWTLLAKIASDKAYVDQLFQRDGIQWSQVDYWTAVKAPHALPAILGNGMPAVIKKLGRPPSSWKEFRTVLGMEGNAQWVRALNACETCGQAVAPAVS